MSEEQAAVKAEQEKGDLSTITIFGETFECDFLDADMLERFTDADQRLIDDLANREEFSGPDTAEAMRKQCRLVDRFFNELFGEGTAEKIFAECKYNLGKHMEAFQMVVDKAQKDPQRINDILGIQNNGGAATLNREMRRAVQRASGRARTASYKGRLEKAEHADTEGSEEEITEIIEGNFEAEEEGLTMAERLSKEGITMEQFEKAMAIIKEADGGQ